MHGSMHFAHPLPKGFLPSQLLVMVVQYFPHISYLFLTVHSLHFFGVAMLQVIKQ